MTSPKKQKEELKDKIEEVQEKERQENVNQLLYFLKPNRATSPWKKMF